MALNDFALIDQAATWVWKAEDVEEGKRLFLDAMARWFEKHQDSIVAAAAKLDDV